MCDSQSVVWRDLLKLYWVVLLLCSPQTGLTHHGNSTARAGGGESFLSDSRFISDPPKALETHFSLQSVSWRSSEDQDLSMGKLDAQFLRFSNRYHMTDVHSLALSIPLGRIVRTSSRGVQTEQRGVGDLSLVHQYTLRGDWAKRAFVTHFFAGFSAPTGHYRPDQILSETILTPRVDGRIDLMTFNAQTSLGAGSWSALTGVTTRLQTAQSVLIYHHVGVIYPMNKTSDHLRWGTDVLSKFGLTFNIASSLAFSVGANWSKHFADQVPDLETSERIKVGGRQQIHGILSLALSLTQQISCDLSGLYNVWAQTEMPQLILAHQANVACRVNWGSPINGKRISPPPKKL